MANSGTNVSLGVVKYIKHNKINNSENFRRGGGSVPTKILMCLHVPKKSAVLACLTMSKKMGTVGGGLDCC